MSYGSAGAAAVQDRLRVEYAPTDRASCKSCGTGMPKGSVKLGEKVRSPCDAVRSAHGPGMHASTLGRRPSARATLMRYQL